MSALQERFAEPPPAYSPVPLWWWSGEALDPARLRWQLERFVAGGVHGVVVMNVAPTSPLYGKDADDPPFMSERWWDLFEGVCRDAEELGVRLWFYDQIGFSGANFQGQVVRAHPEHAGRWIERAVVEGDGELVVECPAAGEPLAAAALPYAGGAPLPVALEGRVARWRGGGRLLLSYAVERGFDYFSPVACRRLLDLVHGRFEARAGHWFGSVIVGSFQDELPSMPTWGPDFAQQFARRAGYDPLPHLAALWEDLGADGEAFRADYHAVRGALAEEAFFRPLHDWHERHGLQCGVDQQFGGREGAPVESSQLYGDYVRTHRWYGAPGSDHHGDAKIHSSIAHHYGRERVWVEAFHTSGWGGTLEETFDWLLPWIGAGANLYDPHATYYSTRAGWWEWAPPATDWRQPYWRHHAHFARAVARLCSMLTWGTHACDLGVLFPAATARAGLRLDGPGPAAARAQSLYTEVVGRMAWFGPAPGVLNRLARDFDVLDDDTVARASAGPAGLATEHERFAAIVLPGCEVLEAATAARLVDFVDAGGTLVAVGALPARVAGRGDDGPVRALRERFERGAARFVADPAALGDALADVPAQVGAPVPTLLRRDGDAAVLFVPAAYPRASEITIPSPDADQHHAWIRDVRCDFDPARYAAALDVEVAGVAGAPELWEPFSGARRTLAAEPTERGVRVRVPFGDGPCAVLVWGGGGGAAAPPADAGRSETIALDGPWEVRVEATLEDDWGDLDAPPAGAEPVVETWELLHRNDGEVAWSTVHATFGPRARWSGPADEEALPAMPSRAAEWSLARGMHKDPLHVGTLGPSGRVPEEFLHFGAVRAGQAVHVRALVHAEQALSTHLAIGAAAAKSAWLDGRAVDVRGAGYLATGPVEVPAGTSVLELRLRAREDVDPLRAHFAFVRDAGGYARPEWLRAAGPGAKSSVVAFSTRVALPADAVAARLLVGANGPCRVLVDGVEVGRQGGFDPYDEVDRDRLQPYELADRLGAGEHELRLELLDLGRSRPTALVDGRVETGAGTVAVRSDADWTATRDGDPVPLDIRLDQRGDPAHAHAWRRPHPLPEAGWLEPERGVADPGAPVRITAHTAADRQRLRLTLPPGARTLRVPLEAGCRAAVEVDGRMLAGDDAPRGDLVVALDALDGRPTPCDIVVDPAPGLAGGALLRGPVAVTVGAGVMALTDWQDAGLSAHSGGVRYRRRLDGAPAGAALRLDLGAVRGTAEVLVDGASAGVRVCSPYAFDLTGLVGPDGATLEVLVLNTLGPHLDAVSPTPYVFPGQRRSGMFGPVRLLVGSPSDRPLPVTLSEAG